MTPEKGSSNFKKTIDPKRTEQVYEYFHDEKNDHAHLPDEMPQKNGRGNFDYFADLTQTSDEIREQRKNSKKQKTNLNDDFDKKREIIRKNREVLEKELSFAKKGINAMDTGFTPEESKKIMEDTKIAEEWLKNEKISQIIVHGGKRPEGKGQNDEDAWALTPDLDAQSASIFLTQYNKRSDSEIYSPNPVSSVIPKEGNEKDLEVDKSSEGIQVWIDTGGRWFEVEKNGDKRKLYFDHHGSGKHEPTSATEMIYEAMKRAEILKEEDWMKDYVTGLTDFDNLSYAQNKNRSFNVDAFQNAWPYTLYNLAREMHPKDVINLFKNGDVKYFNESLTEEDLNGKIGKIKLKNGMNLKDFAEKEASLDRRVSEVAKTLHGIHEAGVYAINQGLNLLDTRVGKIIYQNFIKIDGNTNIIPNHLGYLGTRANNFDTFLVLNHQDRRKDKNNRSRRFFINSNHPGLEHVVKYMAKNKKISLVDLRGTMVVGETTLSEKDFLKIFEKENHELTKNAKFNQYGELTKHIETGSKEKSPKTKKALETQGDAVDETKEAEISPEAVREQKLKRLEEVKKLEAELQLEIETARIDLQKILNDIEELKKNQGE